MAERMRSWVQAVEMGFLRRVAGVSLKDRVRSSAIQEGLGVEPLLLCVERSQLRWFGHLMRMPPGRLPREVFLARPTGRRPRGRPRTRWMDYISSLAWERLGIPGSELADVAGERDVWGLLLKLVPRDPILDKRLTMDGWMDDSILISGDFNIHIGNATDCFANQFTNTLSAFGLTQHITEPTYNQGHTLDLVISKGIDVTPKCIIDVGFSDHFCIFLNVVLLTKYVPGLKLVKRRAICAETSDRFIARYRNSVRGSSSQCGFNLSSLSLCDNLVNN